MANGKPSFEEIKTLSIEKKIKLLSEADKRVLLEFIDQKLPQTNSPLPFDNKSPL